MAQDTHHNALVPGYRLHWYEIQSILGQGGFGITYLALDTNLHQQVAIKEYLPSELATRSQDSAVHPLSDGHSDTFGWGLDRFLTEARTLAQFHHPNIVRVYSVFEGNGTAYMVMEYERGMSLEAALEAGEVQGEDALLSILHSLLDGLALVHEAGFIHRDIKPANIYLRSDGVPVLLDFGSARQALGAATRTLTSLVTPGYAPFEQYQATRENDKQGPWTDIYSIGATLYRAVTGRGPIDALSRADAIIDDGVDPYQPVTIKAPTGFSAGFLKAIDAALAFQSRDRPQSVDAWVARLPVQPGKTTTEGREAAETTHRLGEAPTVIIGSKTGATEGAKAWRGWVGTAIVVIAALAAASYIYWEQTTQPAVVADKPSAAVDAATVSAGPTAGEKPPVVPSGPGTPAGDVSGPGEVASIGDGDEAVEIERHLAEEAQTRLRADQERRRTAEQAARRADELERQRREAERLAAITRAQAEEERRRRAERDIERLLAEASADMQALRLTTPRGNNAYERFQQVLERDPGNADALAGVSLIAERYVALAMRAGGDGRLDRAAGFLERADRVQPNSESVRAVREDLERLRLEHERRLAEQARRTQEIEESPPAEPPATPEPVAEQPEPSTRVAIAAPPSEPAARRPAFAVFPFQSIVNCYYPVGNRAISAARQKIGEHGRAEFKFSYYDDAPSTTQIPAAKEIWSRNFAHREPVMESVIAAGKRLEIDGVLMVWYQCSSNQYVAEDTYNVELYLIDVDGGSAYRNTGNILDSERLTGELFDQFFAAHALAADPVSSEEIRSLFSGRVVEGESRKGAQVTVKYLSDGRLEGQARKDSGGSKFDKGKWWVPSGGTLCIQWTKWRRNQEICNQIEKEGDTVYRIDRKGRRHDDLNWSTL